MIDTDEDIVRRVQAGTPEAFGEIIGRYENRLKRYGKRFLSTDHEIEDLVQDIFVRAYTRIQSFDSERSFSPWLYRIAHNMFVNELRRKGRRGTGIFDADLILPQLAAVETTDSDVLDEELRSELESMLEKLAPKYREVIVLHYLEELQYEEIQEILQIPLGTIGVRLRRAREKLRELYEENKLHTL